MNRRRGNIWGRVWWTVDNLSPEALVMAAIMAALVDDDTEQPVLFPVHDATHLQ